MTSPVEWLTDQQYSELPLTERALAQAASQVGVRETGNNTGPAVNLYQQTAGLGNKGGYAWCASFIYHCLISAGASPAVLPAKGKCAAVRNWVAFGDARQIITAKPKRGRLFFWLNTATGLGHIGFCLGEADAEQFFSTIEGNTNADGDRDGNGVWRKHSRKVKKSHSKTRYGFIDLQSLNM